MSFALTGVLMILLHMAPMTSSLALSVYKDHHHKAVVHHKAVK